MRAILFEAPKKLRLIDDAPRPEPQDGEALVNSWLAGPGGADLDEFEWVASKAPLAPFDFESRSGSERTLIEVKSTRSGHDQAFFISVGELRCAAGASDPYRIYRVSELSEAGGVLRVSAPINALAESIINWLDELPSGVGASSFRIQPSSLEFGESVELS